MKYISKHHIALPENTELVLEPRKSGNVGYYFADPINKVIFWLRETDIVWDLKEVKVEITESHVGKFSEALSLLRRVKRVFT